MEFNTKEFGITVGHVSAFRKKGKSYFNLDVRDESGVLFDFILEPQEIRDLSDALGVVLTLTDLNPTLPEAEPIQSTSET